MTKIIFNSQSRSIETSIHQECSTLCLQSLESNLDILSLSMSMNNPVDIRKLEVFREMLHPKLYLRSNIEATLKRKDSIDNPLYLRNLQNDITANFRVNDGFLLGLSIHIFSMCLDTTLLLGRDELKLAARIYGQYEINGWIDADTKSTVADIIKSGLEQNIYSKSIGWEDLIELLLEQDGSSIIMSTPEYPLNYLGSHPEKITEYEWYSTLEKLEKESWLDVNPSNWEDYSFDRWDALKFNQLMQWAGNTIHNPELAIDQVVKIITEITEVHSYSDTKLTNKESWYKTIEFVSQQDYNYLLLNYK